MITRKMWFISAHEPTKEQIEDAEKMSYQLQLVRSPVIEKDSNVKELVNSLVKNIPWRTDDCFVIMGEPRWIAEFVRLHTMSACDTDGRHDVYVYSLSPLEMMDNGGYIDTVEQKIMYPARLMNLMTTFTKRNVVEKIEDGKVVKMSIFKHDGFIPIL